jgi:hypothetical protein
VVHADFLHHTALRSRGILRWRALIDARRQRMRPCGAARTAAGRGAGNG